MLAFGATIFLRLWDADIRVPFSYSGDGTLNLTLIKTVMERGWFYENPRLGAPSGQELYDYPVLSGDGCTSSSSGSPGSSRTTRRW